MQKTAMNGGLRWPIKNADWWKETSADWWTSVNGRGSPTLEHLCRRDSDKQPKMEKNVEHTFKLISEKV